MCRYLAAKRKATVSSGIAIWVAPVEEKAYALWPSIFEILAPAERASAERLRFERHRHHYVAAHALKRLMLSAFKGLPTSAWDFSLGPHGKPVLRSFPSLHFNLSHCDGLVACALSGIVEVGLDVERVVREAPLDLAGRYFAPEEEQWLTGLPPPLRNRGFFQLWTMKEAFIKATGDGLSQPLQEFAIAFNPLRVSFRHRRLGDERLWRFAQYAIGEEHILSSAWRGDVQISVALEQVKFEDVLSFGKP